MLPRRIPQIVRDWMAFQSLVDPYLIFEFDSVISTLSNKYLLALAVEMPSLTAY